MFYCGQKSSKNAKTDKNPPKISDFAKNDARKLHARLLSLGHFGRDNIYSIKYANKYNCFKT